MEDNQQELPSLTQQDIESVFKGVRPTNMSYLVYKVVQKTLNKANRDRLKGAMMHLSSGIVETKDETTGEVKNIMLKKGITYYKSKESGKLEKVQEDN